MGWLLIGNKSSKRLEIALTNRCRQLVAASTQLVPLGLHLIESCLHRRQRSRPLTVDELSDVFFETPTTSRVTAFASLNRQPVDFTLAEVVLKDLVPTDQPVQITIGTIQAETASYYALTVDDLCSSSRSRQLVTARQIAMYLSKVLTPRSLPEIGRRFGGRDHTTVLHAERKIEKALSGDATLSEEVELLKRMLQD